MKRVLIAGAVIGATVGSPVAGQERALAEIRADGIEAHLRFLADDLLRGRGTGTSGYRMAANYIASYFRSLDLKPRGDGASFFQTVTLRKATVVPEETTLALWRDSTETALTFGEHFIGGSSFVHEEGTVAAPAVFVGFGVVAPEFDYDDYAGIDVRGKVVVTLPGAPTTFPANPAAHYSSGVVKAEAAVARGAVGAITVWSPDWDARLPWPILTRLQRRGGMTWVDQDGEPRNAPPEIRASAIVSEAGASLLWEGAPEPLASVFTAARRGQPRRYALPGEVRLHVTSRHRHVRSPNIVAELTGSDSLLRDEYLVYTAHVDHEGIGEPRNGDSIYNGAIDNAAATAALLQIARAYTRLPDAPRRSVLFVGTTAEEEGLLGADYFVNNPPVPIESIVANINMDGNHMLFPTKDIVALGAEHSSLGNVIRDVTSEIEVGLSPDPMPEQTFFIRSDQYPFVKQGVPALFLINGFESANPEIDGFATIQQWLTTIYHTPQDDLSQPMYYESGVRYAKVAFLTGLSVANTAQRPSWNPGDFFGTKFGRARPAIQ